MILTTRPLQMIIVLAKQNKNGEAHCNGRRVGLEDKSQEFSIFLTVARKFWYSCVYKFYFIYPEKASWEMNLSQKKTFNIFSGSAEQNRVLKLMSAICSRDATSYILNEELWLNELFMELSYRRDTICLTIDCRQNMLNCPRKCRSNADNEKEQFCYSHEKRKDRT